MPNILMEKSNSKTRRISMILLSEDWRTITPWTHKGNPVSYVFSYIRETSKQGDVEITHIYVGPFCLLRAKMISEVNNAS
jgi:hypothetical protein